jgi:REP element-mobilizing transposase RayT
MPQLHRTGRLANYDYSSPGNYFVTIKTLNRIWHFGHVEEGNMILSLVGKQAMKFWLEIPEHFPHATLGATVVMPDHMHGIVTILNQPAPKKTEINVSYNGPGESEHNKNIYMASLSPKAGSLSTIIRSFKSALTKWCHVNGYPEFAWQSRFHDRVIRNIDEYFRIEKYILDNPKNWKEDRWSKFL